MAGIGFSGVVHPLLVLAMLATAGCSESAKTPGDNGGADISVGELRSDAQQAPVRGRHFGRGTYQLAQCGPGKPSEQTCDLSRGAAAVVEVGDDGVLSSSLVLRRWLPVGERREHDCARGCRVVALDQRDRPVAEVPVVWPRGMEPLATPRLALSDLKLSKRPRYSGAVVVRGSGFAPRARVELLQCPAVGSGVDVDAGDCLYDGSRRVRADARGQFEVRFKIAPKFQRSSDELIDCAIDPQLCAVAVPWPSRPGQRMSRATLDQASQGR